jgi:carboxypeptidase T
VIVYRRAAALAVAVLAATALVGPRPASAYPPGDAAYLDHTEMVAAIRAVEVAHPQIVDLFTLGTSHQGRVLWAAKVSDNVGSDESEPEVVFDAGIHAREHMTTEMAVVLLRNLASGYGPNAAITDWVNEREIFIMFNLNPDGSEYDHSSGFYRGWRKNRQPTPNSLEIGTDINRNFGYQWGTSAANASPAVETYRGPSAWSTPEARAFRDFVDSRVVGGEQQITVHVTYHQFGRVVLYPYGYTPEDVPPDMTADDHATLEAMAAEMARMSAYSPAQSADWAGINVGNQMDWMYAAHGIMTFTFEMGDAFYMPASAIGSETARNLEATYYAIDLAGCPYAAVGLEAVYCDPSGFEDIAASPFKTEIRWAAEVGITRGCARNLFCPSTPVTREQMASFLSRALALPAPSRDWFTDDGGSAHEDDINRVADAGVTLGCGGTRYCPTENVTREQMASFLRRAYSLPATGMDFFTDDEASEHEPDINRLAASNVTRGCTPTTYCPLAPVTREQMVTFLYRAEH